MRRIPTTELKPEMVLAKPVFNHIGLVLIGKDVPLTDILIRKLIQLEVDSVFIYDARTDDIEVEDPISPNTQELALKSVKNTFQEMFKEKMVSKPLIKIDLSNVFRPVMDNMLYDLKSNNQAMLMLSTIYTKDLYLYTHSLQVALYSISMGLGKGFNHQQLLELGLGALLHDIGKTKVPLELLEKNDILNKEEYTEIKKHTIFGFDLLRKEHGIPLLSAHCAYQHHERLDGSGYPRGLSGDEIHEYAKIVAIADVYDALTSRRVYRNPVLPHHALEYLYSKAETEFDKEWLEVFKQTVALYPIGVGVTLSSGESGIIVDVNSKMPERPIVRILEDEVNNPIHEPYEIDLSKEFSKVIVKYS